MLHPAKAIGRLATESAFAVLARATALAADGHEVINLGIGQPDFATPEHIVEAAIRALRDGHHGYTPAVGIAPLKEAVAADLHRRLGVDLDPGRVIIVPGGKVTMCFAVLMFGEPGAEILYPDPGFPIYRSLIDYSGAKGVPIPLTEDRGFALTAEDVLARLTPASRLLILNSPANPTGGVTPRAEIDRLVAGLLDFPNVAVLSDEIYSQMLYDGREHVSLLQYPAIADRVILLDGWSKTYAMTGWRLGYGVWPESLVEGATRLAVNSYSCVNAAAQYAGIAALTGPQEPVRAMLDAFAERRKVVVDELNAIPGLSCGMPGGAFYAFPNITATGRSAKDLEVAFLEEAHVATIAGTSFGAQGEGFLRISYANSTENIRRAAERLRALLAQ
ncbi:MAG: pyridoxal phosphate-dependent aminotransferase [Kiloniellales bacterium]|nr:pyridoxal phosphate-dependent aminotransferase [Kiloniellales bacterium]